MLPVEKSCMADCSNAHATALIGDTIAQLGPLVALSAEEAELYQFMRAQQLLQLGEKARGKAAATQLERRLKRLTKATQMRALRAREREFVHENGQGVGVKPSQWKRIYFRILEFPSCTFAELGCGDL